MAFVEFANAERIRVPHGTMAPFGVELRPGSHLIALLERSGALVWSRSFVVHRNAVTIVSVFPPTEFFVGGRNVRPDPTLELVVVPTAESR